MSERCSKYEALFTFADEETLLKHVNSCEDCKAEHEKMQKVSQLLKEVRPAFRSKKNYAGKAVACALFLVMLAGGIGGVGIYQKSGTTDSLTAEELGFPVDAYGFIMVD